MLNTKFATPLNRLGFVIFCGPMALCLIAFSITYQTYYDVSLRWLAQLLLDASNHWQQTVFRFGLTGAVIGAVLAWDLLSTVKRVYVWIVKPGHD